MGVLQYTRWCVKVVFGYIGRAVVKQIILSPCFHRNDRSRIGNDEFDPENAGGSLLWNEGDERFANCSN